ncbi:hypothetical protein [Paenibacillus sp. UMB4589-SE434]|uniref:hypothetical protein n=1 Tax=Paenibacillus sp. UMB4589-SE434 TaxID=3046314 RepID=UPI0025516DEF|nr:hypothetical protein [Paenibacillus sp. UMB4589-SE434]MDK8182125.1 hypothetical protein [Paenibacillus sp. UMB4589-SE434]
MKKIIIGSLCFIILIAGSAAYAAGESLVGKKVTRTVEVIVNGQKTNAEAVVIDGVTYAPVRAVGEITGSTVKYEGGVVTLNNTQGKEQTMNIVQVNSRISDINEAIPPYKRTVSVINENLEKLKGNYENEKIFEKTGIKFEDSADFKRGTNEIKRNESEIDKLQKELVVLEHLKKELNMEK